MNQDFILCQYDTPHERSHLPTLLVVSWSAGVIGAPDQQAVTVPEEVERHLDEEPTWEDAAWV